MNSQGKPDVFLLRLRDTRPILEVALSLSDGTIHDLAGSTAWKLHIILSDGTKLIRNMVKEGLDVEGTLRYTWVETDWDAPTGGPPATVGGLVLSPTIPLSPGVVEHRMLYEVIGPGTARMTFPNWGNSTRDSYDILRIFDDIGQG